MGKKSNLHLKRFFLLACWLAGQCSRFCPILKNVRKETFFVKTKFAIEVGSIFPHDFLGGLLLTELRRKSTN